MSTPSAVSAGFNPSGGTASLGASVKPSQDVSEEDEADGGPSPELGRRTALKLRWLGESPIVLQGRARGK